ncbi:hypothetical protein D3C85_1075420 [compost metagenome]
MNTLFEPLEIFAPQVSLSPLREAATLLMKTLEEPSATMTGAGCLSQIPMLNFAWAALRLLMNTSVEQPSSLIPPAGELIADPMLSPIMGTKLAASPTAIPSRMPPSPAVQIVNAAAVAIARPITAPARNPPSALVCSISSPQRAASNMGYSCSALSVATVSA